MKKKIWNDGIKIIDNNEESFREFHKRGWGADEIMVNREQAEKLCEALLSGSKALAIDDGEYTHVIYIGEGEGK